MKTVFCQMLIGVLPVMLGMTDKTMRTAIISQVAHTGDVSVIRKQSQRDTFEGCLVQQPAVSNFQHPPSLLEKDCTGPTFQHDLYTLDPEADIIFAENIGSLSPPGMPYKGFVVNKTLHRNFYTDYPQYSKATATEYRNHAANANMMSVQPWKKVLGKFNFTMRLWTCQISEPHGKQIFVQTVGPFATSGAFSGYLLQGRIHLPSPEMLKDLEGVFILAATGVFVDAYGNKIDGSVISKHHEAILPLTYHSDAKSTCIAAEEGITCISNQNNLHVEGYGTKCESAPFFSILAGDLRRPGSNSLEWYYQVRLRWTRRATSLKTLSHAVIAPMSLVANPIPMGLESFMFVRAVFKKTGRLRRVHLHGGSLVEEALLFRASPRELGFEHVEKASPESDLLVPKDIGFTTNSEVRAHMLSAVENSSSPSIPNALKCHLKGKHEVIDDVEVPRKADACCSSVTFMENETYTFVVFFNARRERSLLIGSTYVRDISHIIQHAELHLGLDGDGFFPLFEELPESLRYYERGMSFLFHSIFSSWVGAGTLI
jgi:hypothetical protein